jgi:hypothetical protein
MGFDVNLFGIYFSRHKAQKGNASRVDLVIPQICSELSLVTLGLGQLPGCQNPALDGPVSSSCTHAVGIVDGRMTMSTVLKGH